ncbi:MAG: hypothetical protein HYY04_07990 [Chloroflexi bacterium]|nr:hypothetical protein [Chloroflexota bacterium]
MVTRAIRETLTRLATARPNLPQPPADALLAALDAALGELLKSEEAARF